MEHIWMLQFYFTEEEEEKVFELMNDEQFSDAISMVEKKMRQAVDSGRSMDAGLIADLALLHQLNGDEEKALSLYRQAIGVYQEDGYDGSPGYGILLQEFALMLLGKGEADEAIVLLEQAEEIFSVHCIDEVDPLGFAQLQMNMGSVYQKEKRLKEAKDKYNIARDVLEVADQKESPLYTDIITVLEKLRLNLSESGELAIH